MRVVNLSRKPFINRRPIVRLTLALWVLGAILLGLNVTLYRDYWLGTAENRERLTLAEQSIEEQLKELEAQDRALSQLRLTRQNRKAVFLNSLITRRTFPWSDLFDHLEEVTPSDVRLVSVVPAVRIALDPQRSSDSEGSTRRSRSSSGQEPLGDNIALRLSGWAKSEEALATFVDTLYREEVFGAPDLQNESIEIESGGQVRFSLETSFLVESPPPETQAADATGADATGDDATGDDATGDDVTAAGKVDVDSNGAAGDSAEVADNEREEIEGAPASGEASPDTEDPDRVTSAEPTEGSGRAATGSATRPARNSAEAIAQEGAGSRRNPRSPERRTGARTEPTDPPGRDRQEYLEAIRARAAASRSEASRTTRPGRQDTNNPPEGDRPTTPPRRPTDTKPPASSTPRVNGLSQHLWENPLPPFLPDAKLAWEEEVKA